MHGLSSAIQVELLKPLSVMKLRRWVSLAVPDEDGVDMPNLSLTCNSRQIRFLYCKKSPNLIFLNRLLKSSTATLLLSFNQKNEINP